LAETEIALLSALFQNPHRRTAMHSAGQEFGAGYEKDCGDIVQKSGLLVTEVWDWSGPVM